MSNTKKTSTKNKSAKKSAKKISEKKAVQKVTLNKDLKYVYPKDIFGDKGKMKSFRNKVRKAPQRMEADISKLKGADRKAKKAELASYKEEVHTGLAS